MSESNANLEVEEVRRAFEKFGISDLLVDAHGGVSPHIGVLRLCQYLSDNGLLIDLHIAIMRNRNALPKRDE